MIKTIPKLLLLGLFFAFGAVSLLRAQEGGVAEGETVGTNPKPRELSVTAAVPVLNPPPAPILVSPANNSILTSGVVTFVWKAVTGNLAPLDRYELIINGVQRYSGIPLVNHSTDDYVLTFDGTDYHLALRQDRYLPDGVYTWRVRVVDVNDRGTDSTTWNFTIDSRAPPLIITSIDGESVNISATDPSSIPGDPVEVGHPRPEIIGRSDPGTEIQLTVTFSDGSTRQYTASADVNGNFGFTLETLPANQIVALKFVAIDTAGLSTVLDGLRLIYRPAVIVITIPPIIPGLPPTITIEIPPFPTLVVPGFNRIFPTPYPGYIPSPPPPTLRVIELPVFDSTIWLLLILMGILGYLLTLFWIIGNSWLWWPAFLRSLFRFFFFPAPARRHELREQDGQRFLPWCGFTLLWLDERRRPHYRRLISDLNGNWETPFQLELLYQLALHTRHFDYPADRIQISEVRPTDRERVLYLSGESFLIFDPTQQQYTSAIEYFAIARGIDFRFTTWVRRWRSGLGLWILRLPRLFLWLSLAASLWILWHVPLWWSAVLTGLIGWLIIRDWRAKVSAQLEVYVS